MWKFILPLLVVVAGPTEAGEIRTFSGLADASAAEALDLRYMVVAGDEDSSLRIYDAMQPGPPVSSVEWSRFLPREFHNLEFDIEGGARLGEYLVWIGSHGRSKK